MIEEAKRLLARRELWPEWTDNGAVRRDLERLAVEMNTLRLIEEKRARQMHFITNLVSNLSTKKMGA